MASAVANASPMQFAFSIGIAAVVALGAIYGAYTMLIRKRVLEDTPTALIRSASQGYLELQGYAEMMDGLPVIAPLSMSSCVWFRYKVEEKQRSFGGRGERERWRTVDSGVSDSLFYLVDPTGRCAVDPEGASVTPSARDLWYGNSRVPGRRAHSPAWLRYTGLAQLGRRYRYSEQRIESGDPLYALGDFTTHGGSGADFDRSGEISDLLREWKKDNAALLARFDSNEDGEIDMQEWDEVRSAAAQEVDRKRADVAVAPPIDVLGRTRGSRNPFIIAALTEAEMLARFHWSAVGLSALGSVASVVALWMIAVR